MKVTHADIRSFAETEKLLADYFPLATDGTEIHDIAVGSSKVRVRSQVGEFEQIRERYEGFLVTDDNNFVPDFIVESNRHETLDMSEFPNITVVSDADNNTHYAFRWDFVSRIDVVNKRAELLMAPVAAPLSIDTIIRIATSFAAIHNGGFLVHSSCINRDGDAFMFCGVSGSGKSTMAKLSQERYRIFTDEMTLIEKQSDGYAAWGTPFWGEMQRSVHECAPLKGIFHLAKAEENSIEELPRAERIKELMRVIMCFGQEKILAERLLEQAIAFTAVVPFNRLHFKPDISVWDVINEKF